MLLFIYWMYYLLTAVTLFSYRSRNTSIIVMVKITFDSQLQIHWYNLLIKFEWSILKIFWEWTKNYEFRSLMTVLTVVNSAEFDEIAPSHLGLHSLWSAVAQW